MDTLHPSGGEARFQIPETMNPRLATWKSTPVRRANTLADFRVPVGDSEFLEFGILRRRRMGGSVSMVYLSFPGAPCDALGFKRPFLMQDAVSALRQKLQRLPGQSLLP